MTQYETTVENTAKNDSLIALIQSLNNDSQEIFTKIDTAIIKTDKINYVLKTGNYKEVIRELCESSIYILDIISKSMNTNYNKTMKSVERIYDNIYQIMKIELLLTPNDSIFQKVISDEISTSFILQRIENDISKDDNRELKQRLGNKNNLLDKKIIRKIALNEYKYLEEQIKDNYVNQVNEYEITQTIIKDENNNKERTLHDIKYSKDEIKNCKKKIRIRKIAIALNLLLYPTYLFNAKKFFSKMDFVQEYWTTTTRYDLLTKEEEITEGYSYGKEDAVIIKEYTPWIIPKDSYYKHYERSIYTYHLNEQEQVRFKSISSTNDVFDILDQDYNTRFEREIITSESRPNNLEKYTDDKYEVIKIEKDLSKQYVDELELGAELVLQLFILYIINLAIWLTIIVKKGLTAEFYNERNDYIKRINELKEEITVIDQYVLDKKEKLKLNEKYINELYELFQEEKKDSKIEEAYQKIKTYNN